MNQKSELPPPTRAEVIVGVAVLYGLGVGTGFVLGLAVCRLLL